MRDVLSNPPTGDRQTPTHLRLAKNGWGIHRRQAVWVCNYPVVVRSEAPPEPLVCLDNLGHCRLLIECPEIGMTIGMVSETKTSSRKRGCELLFRANAEVVPRGREVKQRFTYSALIDKEICPIVWRPMLLLGSYIPRGDATQQ